MTPEKARKQLFSKLEDFLSVSHKKFMVNNNKAKERRAWARVGISAIKAYGKLLETVQLDELMKEIETIKKELETR